ncbi:MAG: TylF/MycF family methyltransferase, partial [Holosporales bacterium]|nr:TylF/MycF family methyltransferase [Holosporales bacterium]
MSLGLFRKSLALHQWIANKCGMQVFISCEGTTVAPISSWDDVFPTRFKDDPDYVLTRTLELVGEQLKDQPGSAAEVGVYKGTFAHKINQVFPDRKLFLYDTWEGPDVKTCSSEERGKSCIGVKEDWSDETPERLMEIVREGMVHPEMCVFRRGLFPETILPEDENEKFVLVSLDVNLYQPTRAALEFF